MLDKQPTESIDDSINFSKANAKFWLILHYNRNESYLYVNKTEVV